MRLGGANSYFGTGSDLMNTYDLDTGEHRRSVLSDIGRAARLCDALTSLADVVRMTRSSTVDVLQMNYVRPANLKGLSPRRVLFTHVPRNSLLPRITVVAIGIGWLIGGLIVIIYVVANLIADFLYAVLNPRLRYT